MRAGGGTERNIIARQTVSPPAAQIGAGGGGGGGTGRRKKDGRYWVHAWAGEEAPPESPKTNFVEINDATIVYENGKV